MWYQSQSAFSGRFCTQIDINRSTNSHRIFLVYFQAALVFHECAATAEHKCESCQIQWLQWLLQAPGISLLSLFQRLHRLFSNRRNVICPWKSGVFSSESAIGASHPVNMSSFGSCSTRPWLNNAHDRDEWLNHLTSFFNTCPMKITNCCWQNVAQTSQ